MSVELQATFDTENQFWLLKKLTVTFVIEKHQHFSNYEIMKL